MLEEKETIGRRDYSDYYENHELITRLDIHLPLVKMDLMMEYICKSPINIMEQYICRCIKQGITERYGIMDVLALEDEMVNNLIQELIDYEIIKEEKGQLIFANEIYSSEENIPKITQRKREVVMWCYKGLMNADKKIDTHMKAFEDTVKIEAVLEQAHQFYLLPNVLIDVKPQELKALQASMLHYPKKGEDEILEIVNLQIVKPRTVLYGHYKLLFFKGTSGDVKVLVHKASEEQEVDKAFTRTIQRLYDRSELFTQIRCTTSGDEAQFESILRQIKHQVL